MPDFLVLLIVLVLLVATLDAARWVNLCMKDTDNDYTVGDALAEWWHERVLMLFKGGGGNGPRAA